MEHCSLEDFPEIDSLYRLVNIAARRANQVNRSETRALVPTGSRKPTMVALDEVREGKIGYRTGDAEEDEYEVG